LIIGIYNLFLISLTKLLFYVIIDYNINEGEKI
jgi:hypothetical protein